MNNVIDEWQVYTWTFCGLYIVLDEVVWDVDGEVLQSPSQVHKLLSNKHHVLVLHIEVVRLLTDGILDQVHLDFLCSIEYYIEGQGVHRCVPVKIYQIDVRIFPFYNKYEYKSTTQKMSVWQIIKIQNTL